MKMKDKITKNKEDILFFISVIIVVIFFVFQTVKVLVVGNVEAHEWLVCAVWTALLGYDIFWLFSILRKRIRDREFDENLQQLQKCHDDFIKSMEELKDYDTEQRTDS